MKEAAAAYLAKAPAKLWTKPGGCLPSAFTTRPGGMSRALPEKCHAVFA